MQCPKKKFRNCAVSSGEALRKLLIAVLYHGGHGLITFLSLWAKCKSAFAAGRRDPPQGDEFLLFSRRVSSPDTVGWLK